MSDGFVEQRTSERRLHADRRGGADRRVAERRLLIQWVAADSRSGHDRRLRERRAFALRRSAADRRESVTRPPA